MQQNCMHRILSGDQLFCISCTAIRDAVDEPWRHLSMPEKCVNKLLAAAVEAIRDEFAEWPDEEQEAGIRPASVDVFGFRLSIEAVK